MAEIVRRVVTVHRPATCIAKVARAMNDAVMALARMCVLGTARAQKVRVTVDRVGPADAKAALAIDRTCLRLRSSARLI
jgi:hypothetical protein